MFLKYFLTLLTSSLHIASSQPSPHGFKVQFIGKTRYVTPQQEQKRDFCENFWCTNDADLLFTQSSQYSSSDPCIDFKNFSVGNALEVAAVNERYPYLGLVSQVEFKFWERLRRILTMKIEKKEEKFFKIAKNSFQKCTKSQHVLRHLEGHQEILEYLQSLGKSPYLTHHIAWNPNLFNREKNFGLFYPKNSSSLDFEWSSDDFNLTKIFSEEPVDSLWFFLSYELQRCENDLLCFRHVKTSKFNRVICENLLEVLEYMNDNFIAGLYGKKELKEKMFDPAMRNFGEFSRRKENLELIYEIERELEVGEEGNSVEEKNKLKKSSKIVKIRDLKEVFEYEEINWLDLINKQLLRGSRVSGGDYVKIEDFKLLKMMVKNLKNSEKSIIADYFTLSYLFLYQFIFTFHFDEDFVGRNLGTKKSPQRWEICLLYTIVPYHFPALLQLYKNHYENEGNHEETQKFFREIATEVRRNFVKNSNLPLESAVEIFLKLKNVKFVRTYDVIERLEEFYEELELEGNEKFFESFLEMKKFNQKIEREGEGNWRRKIEKICSEMKIKYDLEENVMYIPPVFLIYPWYHPNRPLFFNMATIFIQILTSFHVELKSYFPNFSTSLEDPIKIAYNYYKNFHTKDLQIGANYLRNQQLFFMALALNHFNKYHKSVPEDMNAFQRLQIEFMHVEFKSRKEFQEAFECEMSEEETEMYQEYLRRFYEILEAKE